MWYTQYVLDVKCVGWPPAPSPPAKCTKEEMKRMEDLRTEWRKEFLPTLMRNGNGAFIDTCIVHE